jgi:hypothetical protein
MYLPSAVTSMRGHLEHITRSRTALTLAVLAAILWVVGDGFGIGAYASLGPASVRTFTDLLHATYWLKFAAGVLALASVCAAGWELVLRRRWDSAWESGVAAVGTLLVTIGLLIDATSQEREIPSESSVVGAVGFGIWALLVLSGAARRSLREQAAASGGASLPRQSIIWLVAAIGLAVLAVGWGLTPTSAGIGIAAGVLGAVGIAIVLGGLASARVLGYLPSRAVPAVLAGLAALVVAFAAEAVVAGILFGSSATLTDLRVSVPVALTIELIAVASLGIAAWLRIAELVVGPPEDLNPAGQR